MICAKKNTLKLRHGLLLGSALLLAACGTESPTSGTGPASTMAGGAPAPAPAPVGDGAPAPAAVDLPKSPTEASRFLVKSTFGSTQAEIDALMKQGYSAWIEDQAKKPSLSHLAYVLEQVATLPEGASQTQNDWSRQSIWRAALTGEDALRQRVAFGLSQIIVVSQADPDLSTYMAASFYDILVRNALGNFRTLLEEVSLSPAMGTYLTYLGNRKADLATGRMPDENYARELMQLFTIGLLELEQDGTPKRDPATGATIETYGPDDIQGLARVFTGFSWAGPDKSPARFVNNQVVRLGSERHYLPMQGYPDQHEQGPKSFLGKTVTASTPEASLKQALDILFNHENVGPFIGRQLIQRMVTSNPSPAYVRRVAAAFADNGSGVRGDMKAVVKAVLLDPEAVTPPADWDFVDGRLREPVLRMTSMLRALNVKSVSQRFTAGDTLNPATAIGQSPLGAPSVFNFYRPGYVPPNSDLSKVRMTPGTVAVAPELQLTNEVSVTGWLLASAAAIDKGFGAGGDMKADFAPLLPLAHTPKALLDRIILLMAPGQITRDLRMEIERAVETIPLTAAADDAARLNRVKLAVALLVASPEFMVQR